jgi:tRNA G18 (ribose-2'-O)-methylase SpoU
VASHPAHVQKIEGRRVSLAERVHAVASLADERLADYRALRDRDLRRERGAFIAESAGVLRVIAAQRRFSLRSVLLASSRVPKLAALLEGLPPEVPIYQAEQELLNGIVGFRIHRGVLAAVARPEPIAPEALLAREGDPPRIVVLESLTNHDNVGGVFRNAAAFGAGAVLHDGATCDPLYRKAIRVSVGAALLVPFAAAPTSDELIALVKRRGYTVVALTPQADAREIHDVLAEPPARVALLLGTEGAGLRPASMAAADVRVRIDIEPGFDSLNVATAGGIALHAYRMAQR